MTIASGQSLSFQTKDLFARRPNEDGTKLINYKQEEHSSFNIIQNPFKSKHGYFVYTSLFHFKYVGYCLDRAFEKGRTVK